MLMLLAGIETYTFDVSHPPRAGPHAATATTILQGTQQYNTTVDGINDATLRVSKPPHGGCWKTTHTL